MYENEMTIPPRMNVKYKPKRENDAYAVLRIFLAGG
jgi:hypothetical protein